MATTDSPEPEAALQMLNMAQASSQEALRLFEPLDVMDDLTRAELDEMAASDRTRSVVQAIVGLTQAHAATALLQREANGIAWAAHSLNLELLRAARQQGHGASSLLVPGRTFGGA